MKERNQIAELIGHVGPDRFLCIYDEVNKLGNRDEVDTVLDVGGEEDTSTFLKLLFPRATSMTLNLQKIKLPSLIVGDAHLIPFKDNSFDVILSGEIIEHLLNPLKFIREAKRVLKPQGVFIITTPNLASIFNRLLIVFGYSPLNYTVVPGQRIGLPRWFEVRDFGNQDHLRVFTPRALKQLAVHNGMQCIGFRGVNVTNPSAKWKVLRKFLSHLLPSGMREDIIAFFRKPA